MGFLDKYTKRGGDLKAKAADLAATHADTIDTGIGKAADAANKATKGRYGSKIDTAALKAMEAADKLADDGKGPGAGPAAPRP